MESGENKLLMLRQFIMSRFLMVFFEYLWNYVRCTGPLWCWLRCRFVLRTRNQQVHYNEIKNTVCITYNTVFTNLFYILLSNISVCCQLDLVSLIEATGWIQHLRYRRQTTKKAKYAFANQHKIMITFVICILLMRLMFIIVYWDALHQF